MEMRQTTLLHQAIYTSPQYENDYVTEAKFHVYRLCVKQLIVVEIYKNTHANVYVTIHMLT